MPVITSQTVASQLVSLLRTLSGAHGAFRPIHARGLVGSGTFQGSETAPSITRAAHLQGQEIPVTFRLSNADGHPLVPDGKPGVRALSVKFALPDGSQTDLLANSVEGFFAPTPEQFRDFLQALVPGPSGPDPDAFSKALQAHPAAAEVAARIARRPVPASYAQTSYFGIHAFRFVASDGSARFARYQWEPEAGEMFLSTDSAATRPPNFLADELAQRLSHGPVCFRLMLQLAANGDPTHDCTLLWPTDRPRVTLGHLEISSLEPDSRSAERTLLFDPARLTDGIELSDDPILLARSPAYVESFAIRTLETPSEPY